jgi:hypothetical protein
MYFTFFEGKTESAKLIMLVADFFSTQNAISKCFFNSGTTLPLFQQKVDPTATLSRASRRSFWNQTLCWSPLEMPKRSVTTTQVDLCVQQHSFL